MSWTWIGLSIVQAVHDRQLAEHGGVEGIRDQGALESAMARPQNLKGYGDPDCAALAAAYAFGIARNHPFVDGNKRTAWVIARLFLLVNDARLQFDREEAIRMMLALAGGAMSEEEAAQWFRDRIS